LNTCGVVFADVLDHDLSNIVLADSADIVFRESLEQMERVEQEELIDLVLRRHFPCLQDHHLNPYLSDHHRRRRRRHEGLGGLGNPRCCHLHFHILNLVLISNNLLVLLCNVLQFENAIKSPLESN
jgi:hypothetical protein